MRRWQEYAVHSHVDSDGAYTWYRRTHGDDMAVAYLVAERDGDLVPIEIRVYPGSPYDPILDQPSTRLVIEAAEPGARVSATLLREISVETDMRDLRDEMRADELGDDPERDADSVLGIYVNLGVTAAAILKATIPTSRREASTNDLLAVAYLYAGEVRKGTRRDVNVAVQQHLARLGRRFERPTVANLVNKARREGYLTKAPPGRAGGHLTPEAEKAIRMIRA